MADAEQFWREVLPSIEGLSDHELLGLLRGLSDADIGRMVEVSGPALLERIYQACCVRDDCQCPQGLTGCAHASLAPLRPVAAEVEGLIYERRSAHKFAQHGQPDPSPAYTLEARIQVLRQRAQARTGLFSEGDVWAILQDHAAKYRRLLAIMAAVKRRKG